MKRFNRCCICDGPLSNGICQFCGYNNSRNDRSRVELNEHNRDVHVGDCEDILNKEKVMPRPPIKFLGQGKNNTGKKSSPNAKANKVTYSNQYPTNKDIKYKTDPTLKKSGPIVKTGSGVTASNKEGSRKPGVSTDNMNKKKHPVAALIRTLLLILILWLVSFLGPKIYQYRDLLPVLAKNPSLIISFIQGEVRTVYRTAYGALNDGEDPYGCNFIEKADFDESDPDYVEQVMESGYYLVGRDMPAGAYQISFEEGEPGFYQAAFISLYYDEENKDYFQLVAYKADDVDYLTFADTDYYMHTRVCYLEEGNVLEIDTSSCNLNVILRGISDGSETDTISQDITESIELKGKMEIGKDLPAGIYDLVLESGEGAFVSFGCEGGATSLYGIDRYVMQNIYVRKASSDGRDTSIYRRLPLNEGDVIMLVDDESDTGKNVKVRLVPSA